MHSSLRCERLALPEGGTGLFTQRLADCAWIDSPLLRRAWVSPMEFWQHSRQFHGAIPQVQFAVSEGQKLVGGIVLTRTVDGQVGDCLVVIHNFLMELYRGSVTLQRKLLRLALKECRDQGLRWLIITRQMPDGTQRITYKEVPNG